MDGERRREFLQFCHARVSDKVSFGGAVPMAVQCRPLQGARQSPQKTRFLVKAKRRQPHSPLTCLGFRSAKSTRYCPPPFLLRVNVNTIAVTTNATRHPPTHSPPRINNSHWLIPNIAHLFLATKRLLPPAILWIRNRDGKQGRVRQADRQPIINGQRTSPIGADAPAALHLVRRRRAAMSGENGRSFAPGLTHPSNGPRGVGDS
jgi:hypothetical protein